MSIKNFSSIGGYAVDATEVLNTSRALKNISAMHMVSDHFVDANKDILELNISEDEMKKRANVWKNPNSSPKSGVLAKYKRTVQSASKGAITD